MDLTEEDEESSEEVCARPKPMDLMSVQLGDFVPRRVTRWGCEAFASYPYPYINKRSRLHSALSPNLLRPHARTILMR